MIFICCTFVLQACLGFLFVCASPLFACLPACMSSRACLYGWLSLLVFRAVSHGSWRTFDSLGLSLRARYALLRTMPLVAYSAVYDLKSVAAASSASTMYLLSQIYRYAVPGMHLSVVCYVKGKCGLSSLTAGNARASGQVQRRRICTYTKRTDQNRNHLYSSIITCRPRRPH